MYVNKLGVDGNIGIYFTVYACTLLLTRPLIGKLSDKFGVIKILFPAMVCFMAAYWLISFASALWMFILAAIVSAFGLGACQPSVQALCMKCVPPERRGAASSTCYIAQDLGNLAGPVAAGLIVEYFGYVSMWRIMTIPILIACGYVLLIRGRIRQVEQEFLQQNS